MSEKPSYPSFEELFAHNHKPTRFLISLSPRQIYAIGHVVAQWSALNDAVDRQILFWRRHVSVPAELREERVQNAFKRRLTYLRDLSAHVLKDKPAFLAEFRGGLGKIANCKGKREWFAHGSFTLDDNQDGEWIGVTNRHGKHRISTEDAEKLADDIALLTGWLMNFDWRVNEDVHRALHDRLQQLAASRSSPTPDPKPSKP